MKANLLILLLFFIINFSFAQSFNEVKKSAEQGDAVAQFNLGVKYSKGRGTLTDKKKAFYWHKNSAEQGYAEAQYFLGFIYYTGKGTLTDKKQAAFWIRKSYENGFEKAKEFWDDKELYKY
jgi:TPR repeat protein